MKAKAIKAFQRLLDCEQDMIRTLALYSIDDIGGYPGRVPGHLQIHPGKI